jgi:hypothetical protein
MMASEKSCFGWAKAAAERTMLLALLLAGAVALAAGTGGCATGEPAADSPNSATAGEWQSLFDGEALDDWRNPYDWGETQVVDDEIRLRSDEKFFLVTDTTFRDFVFEGEVKVPDRESNSGFMFRANVEPNRVSGYQAEVDPSDRAFSGGLYDEARRGWLHPQEGTSSGEEFRKTVGQAFQPDEWNRYRIRAEGDSLEIWVNGERTTAYRDSRDREGVIGIQHHGEDGKVYRFRDLRVKRLVGEAVAQGDAPPNTLTEAEREAGWQLLFDGESFDGWTALGAERIPAEHWQVVSASGGAIKKRESDNVPTAPDGQPLEGGDIMTEDAYRDFELKWQWKVAEGANSGLKYNVSEQMSTAAEPTRAALGFEYQILDDERHPDAKDPTHRAGALYDLIRADASRKQVRPPGQWNQSRLVFDGSHGEHWLNGEKLLEYDLDSERFADLFAASKYADVEDFARKRNGRIVLQDHSDAVWYRNIKLRER